MSTCTIQASPQWWRNTVKLLGLSTDNAKDSADSTSFLSCALFTLNSAEKSIVSESTLSTTFVNLKDFDGEVSTEGEETFMVKCSDLSGFISNMPTDEDIILEYDPEEKSYSVYNDSETVTFSSTVVNIVDDDMKPQAVDSFQGDTVVVPPVDFTVAYKRGSTMVRKESGDELTGFDPLSGCSIAITKDGVQFLSLCMSSAESFIPLDTVPKSAVNSIITMPSFTAPRIDAMSQCGDAEMIVGIGKKDKKLHLHSAGYHMVIIPMNTGRKKTTAISFATILGVLTPAWKHRIATVRVPASEFFTSLGRASTISPDTVNMKLTDIELTITSEKNTASSTPFEQLVSCTTQWVNKPDADVVMKTSPTVFKTIAPYVDKKTDIIFDVVFKDNGSPWTLIVRGEDYDENDPHDFFMILLF